MGDSRRRAHAGQPGPGGRDCYARLFIAREKPPITRPFTTKCRAGIGQSQQESGIPHSFGVLTCETLEQALNRAGIKAGNKGFEAATAAIEMVSLRRKLEQGRDSHGQVLVRGVEGGTV